MWGWRLRVWGHEDVRVWDEGMRIWGMRVWGWRIEYRVRMVVQLWPSEYTLEQLEIRNNQRTSYLHIKYHIKEQFLAQLVLFISLSVSTPLSTAGPAGAEGLQPRPGLPGQHGKQEQGPRLHRPGWCCHVSCVHSQGEWLQISYVYLVYSVKFER